MAQISPVYPVAILGAGPAGLTASYLLSKNHVPCVVLEADPIYVGGISRTVERNGYCVDIGGHRFFSKSREVEDLWTEILPRDLLQRPRSSRIYYQGKFFSYPLKPFEALFKLGVFESMLCVVSYLKARLFPIAQPTNFQDWVSNQFGHRLFGIFFKTYTEKVWGMSCKEISADWAAQRIKGLSLAGAVLGPLKKTLAKLSFWRAPGGPAGIVKTLIESFRYPRKGPGMMWAEAARKTIEQGGSVKMGCCVTQLKFDDKENLWEISYTENAEEKRLLAKDVISSLPIRELIGGLEPQLKARAHAEQLKYRDFLIVAIVVTDRGLFQDNWLYIHSPSVKVGRIQNFKSWSPEMVPDHETNCYGLEYFCFDGDSLWSESDQKLIELAQNELEKLGIAKRADMRDAWVIRQKKAYPVYDANYATHVEAIRQELSERFPSLHLVGRNGMHKYNNQDHSMMTAMLTVENIMAGKPIYDIWSVNEDAEYQESGLAGSQSGLRQVPRPLAAKA